MPRPDPAPGRLRPAAAVVVVGYLAVVSSLVLAGLLLTHVLVDGTVGRGTTTSTRWLSDTATAASTPSPGRRVAIG